jgi:hypothetical protein
MMAAAERNGTIRYLDCEPADGITVAARNRDFGTSRAARPLNYIDLAVRRKGE